LRKRIKSIAGAPNYIFVSIMVSMPIARSYCLAGAGLRNELFWTEKYILYPAVQNPEFYALIDVRFGQ
jgi:hypothetical protein